MTRVEQAVLLHTGESEPEAHMRDVVIVAAVVRTGLWARLAAGSAADEVRPG